MEPTRPRWTMTQRKLVQGCMHELREHPSYHDSAAKDSSGKGGATYTAYLWGDLQNDVELKVIQGDLRYASRRGCILRGHSMLAGGVVRGWLEFEVYWTSGVRNFNIPRIPNRKRRLRIHQQAAELYEKLEPKKQCTQRWTSCGPWSVPMFRAAARSGRAHERNAHPASTEPSGVISHNTRKIPWGWDQKLGVGNGFIIHVSELN